MLLPFILWLGFVVINHQSSSFTSLDLFFDDFYSFMTINFAIFANSPLNQVFYTITNFFFDSGDINDLVVMLLNYWCSISIIYLVFDIVMYVPLLAHRWLDKGVVE